MEHIELLQTTSSTKPFIEANTLGMDLHEMQQEHIIPVFSRDNEPLISHGEFVQLATDVMQDHFHGEHILQPSIRVSHPIKGRIPEAKHKPAEALLPWEKTLYYERMMFVIEVASIQDTIDGNTLSLTMGGVKAYHQDHLYSRTQSEQHFKLFVGFQNKVCCNLCVWTDGYRADVKVKDVAGLKEQMHTLLARYHASHHLECMKAWTAQHLTEDQFAHLIGRCRMYPHLPSLQKEIIPSIGLGDQQLGMVVKDYYKDKSFCKDRNGNINLWRLYNLFTGANKSSYIDSFLDRTVQAGSLVDEISEALNGAESWYV